MVPLILLTVLALGMTTLPGQPRNADLDTARLLAIDGEYEDALPLFLRLLEDEPDDAQLNYYTGVCYFFLDDSDRSILFLKAAVNYGAEFPEAYYWLGQANLAERNLEMAFSTTARGLELFPRNEKLLYLYDYIRRARAGEYRPFVDVDSKSLVIPVQPPLSDEPVDDFR